MKIPAMLLILLVGWLAFWKWGGELTKDISELTWLGVTASLTLGFLASLALVFVGAGRIRLEEERLVVSTPVGFCKIPYSQIETIRRCRRKGRPQHLQIIFETLGERKILRLRPRQVTEFAALLHRKCPHLSSSSDIYLVRQGGEGKLVHSV